MLLDLPHVSADRLPALDLPFVLIRKASAHVVAAVPLKPATRIVGMDPALTLPFRQRLAGVDTEEIACAIVSARRKLCTGEPAFGKLAAAIGHVLAAENPEPEHVCRRELRLEFWIEAAADR